jgi:phosphoglycolate phosphatase-like HAD superfamily hydrolase
MDIVSTRSEGCILFLDFDGVICNSINECFVVSWLAYHQDAKTPDHIALADYRAFESYRPFIRRGGDYVLLQRCIATRQRLESQDDFDRAERCLDPGESERYHERFYEARSRLLESRPEYWLSLNPLYPHVAGLLGALSRRSVIITTKEVDFALRILSYHSIDWPSDRIICSGRERKQRIIGDYLSRESAPCAVLVDDQIDHLVPCDSEAISVWLAGWGYVKTEWTTNPDVPVLTTESAGQFLRRFL